MKDSLIDVKVGKRHFVLSACHRIPERSFHYRGKPVICYRCLGLNGSFALALLIQFLAILVGLLTRRFFVLGMYLNFYTDSLWLMFLASLAAQLPFVIDGTVQAFTRYRSNNPMRLITGILGGLGQFNLTYIAAIWVRALFL